MNSPSYNLAAAKTANIYSVFQIAPYVPEASATRRQTENLSLYRECFAQVVRDDTFALHLLMMPNMTGSNIVYTVDEEPELAQSVANLTNQEIGPDDMIVVVGNKLFDANVGEDEMLEIVLADLAVHLNKMHPVADRTTGKLGNQIGWAAIAAVICSSHEVLRLLESEHALIERIRQAVTKSIHNEARWKGCGNPDLVIRQNKAALEAIDKVCEVAFETYGDYISLPAKGSSIATAAKGILLNVSTEMDKSFKAII